MSDSCASNDADSDESKGLLALAAQLAFEVSVCALVSMLLSFMLLHFPAVDSQGSGHTGSSATGRPSYLSTANTHLTQVRMNECNSSFFSIPLHTFSFA